MNIPPNVNVEDQIARLNTFVEGVDFISATDPDGDEITQYRIRDLNAAANSSRIFTNGNARGANVFIVVAADELDTLQIRAGNQVGSQRFEIQAFDGVEWGPTAAFTFYSVTANNRLPVVNASTIRVVANERVRLTDFITGNDPDGFPIDRIRIKDAIVGRNSGFFEVNGVRMTENEFFFVNREDFDNVFYVGALNGQTERIFTRVRDGRPDIGGQWSEVVQSEAVTTGNANRPFVQANTIVLPQRVTIPIETLISVFDADGNSIKAYRFLDTSSPDNSAFLSTNGNRRNSNRFFQVSADQLNTVGLTSAAIFRDDQIRVQAFDGRHWSPIQTLRVTADVQPTLDADPILVVEDLERMRVVDLFTQSDVGPRFRSYEIIDTSSNNPDPDVDTFANLVQGVNDYFVANERHSFTANEFEQLFVEGGKFENRHLDEIYVRANNGRFNTRWERLNVRSEPEYLQSHHIDNGGAPLNWTQFLPRPIRLC